MKKLFLILFVAMAALTASAQQKIAYIYSEKVFSSMPEYNTAVTQLENYAKSASATAEEKLKDVQRKFAEYKQLESSLSTDMRNAMRTEIVKLEQEANSYEDEFFEEGGPMTKKRDELMKPLEARVVSAVDKLAQQEKFNMILDLSVAKIALYKDPNLDVTQKVIDIVNNL